MNCLVAEERLQRSGVVHRVRGGMQRGEGPRAAVARRGLWHGPFPTEVAALAAAKRT